MSIGKPSCVSSSILICARCITFKGVSDSINRSISPRFAWSLSLEPNKYTDVPVPAKQETVWVMVCICCFVRPISLLQTRYGRNHKKQLLKEHRQNLFWFSETKRTLPKQLLLRL